MYEVREQVSGLMAHEKGLLIRVFQTYKEASNFVDNEHKKQTERCQRLYVSKA